MTIQSNDFHTLPGEDTEDIQLPPITQHAHHTHDHDHTDLSARQAQKKLILACCVAIIFMIIEVVAGYLSNSLALLTDASHLLSDVCAFLLSLFAIWVSTFKGTDAMSFGYHRAEILGALCSIIMIWGITGGLVYVSIRRIQAPIEVNGTIMLITAAFGTISNLFITYILKVHHHGIGHNHTHTHTHDHEHNHTHDHEHNHTHNYTHKKSYSPVKKLNDHDNVTIQLNDPLIDPNNEKSAYTLMSDKEYNSKNESSTHTHTPKQNLNLRAAYIHAIGDLIQNIGVLIAGFIIWLKPSWSIADPISTLLFSVLVIYTTISILTEALNVLMEGTPLGIDFQKLRKQLSSIEGVLSVHDLHIWSLSVNKPSLACHLVIDIGVDAQNVLETATSICQAQFGVLHTTIQIDLCANKFECKTKDHYKCSS